MKRRKWDAKVKALVLLEGLKGKPVGEICIGHQISQAKHYQCQDQFLSRMEHVLSNNNRRETVLTKENARLKKIIEELPVEVKKQKSV
jgi:nicotinamide mononucleotide (NMN) deamidase PncC